MDSAVKEFIIQDNFLFNLQMRRKFHQINFHHIKNKQEINFNFGNLILNSYLRYLNLS